MLRGESWTYSLGQAAIHPPLHIACRLMVGDAQRIDRPIDRKLSYSRCCKGSCEMPEKRCEVPTASRLTTAREGQANSRHHLGVDRNGGKQLGATDVSRSFGGG